MTNEPEAKQGRYFVTYYLPWLVAAGMFFVYLLTLDHRVTLVDLERWINLSGNNWRPEIFGPVTFLATYPLRWLPGSLLPIALPLFSAVCAALTLYQLARTVALFPYDRTHDQRQRELSEVSILSIRSAWAPPVFAALVCGLQMTFWENSISGTSEIFDLLFFAYVIRCLMEFRIDRRDSWLIRAALVYGLGMANNWAMIGFFPAFLAALIWIKGLEFFNVRFLLRMAGCGFAGLLFILFFPVLLGMSHLKGLEFGAVLHETLASQKNILFHFPRGTFVLLALTSLIPIFMIGIRWAAYFGDNSQLGILLATSMFHIVHGLFFLACLWVALDAPFSPRRIVPRIPFLTFYYLGAICLGYFAGYFLLIFGTKLPKSRQRVHPIMGVINIAVTALVWFLIIAAPLALIFENLPRLRARMATTRILDRYFARIEETLPAEGAVLLSDDSIRLYYLAATLEQKGVASKYLLIDTGSVGSTIAGPYYFKFLEKKYPQFNLSKAIPEVPEERLTDVELIHLLENLSEKHRIYYLHPSFGYYMERFYPQPHGLVYQLKPYPTNAWTMPPVSEGQIAENQAFWKAVVDQDMPAIVRAIQPPEHPANPTPWQRFRDFAHLTPEPDLIAAQIGAYYSRSFNYWGVELQKAGLLAEAEDAFQQSQKLFPENAAARINFDFNQTLRAGTTPVIKPPKAIEDNFGAARSWTQVISQDGPFDDPNFCYELGVVFAQGGLYREAIQQFERIRTLAPNDAAAPLVLAQLFLITQARTNQLSYCFPYTEGYSNALAATDQALRITPNDPAALFVKSTTLLQIGSAAEAIPILSKLLILQTNNYNAQFNRAIAYLQTGDLDSAKLDYEVLEKVAPTSYKVQYGLAEIAYRKKDMPTAIKYYESYLTNAPPDAAETKFVSSRLKDLKDGGK